MRVNVLGSGAGEGIPAIFCECALCKEAREKRIFRTRSQILIDGELLIDFPPETYYRALYTGIEIGKAENVLITHSHSDHCYVGDLQLRRACRWKGAPLKPIHVHANKTVCALIGGENDSDNLIVHVRKAYDTFSAGGFTVTALPATHIPDEECLIWLIAKQGKTILYATDTGYLQEEVFSRLSERGVRLDALIADGTYGASDIRDCGHMGFGETDKLRRQFLLRGIADTNTRFFITHIFHGAAPDLASLEKAVPEGYELLRDGYVFEI